ncbi:MAG: hypothetical protein WD872_00010 [Pirellulaceae bacterium]
MAAAPRRGVDAFALGRQSRTVIWWTGLLLLLGMAALFAARRLVGGLTLPLAGGLLVNLAIALGAAAALLRLPGGAQRSLAWQVVPGLAAGIVLAALTLPGTAAPAVALAWFLLVVIEGASWLQLVRLRRAATPPNADFTRSANIEEVDNEEEISARLVQQLSRERTAEGGEALHALVRTLCQPEDQQVVVHLAFCPPLDTAPQLAAHVLEGDAVEARVTLAQTFGARIEVRLARPATPGQTVLIEMLGATRPPTA